MTEPDQPSQPPAPPPYPYGAYPGSYPPAPPQPYAGYAPPPRAPQNGLGIASLIVAVVALLTLVGGIILGVVAIILGSLGWGRARRGEATNGGVAIAGIVLGVLSIIVSVAVIAIGVWGFNEIGVTDFVKCVQKAGDDTAAQQKCEDRFERKIEDRFSVTLTPTPTP